MADLITLDDYKTVLDIDPTDTREDDRITKLIPWASVVISNFAERDFGSDVVTEERTFTYTDDDAGYLDIDDADNITSVKLVVPHGDDLALTTDEWVAMPPRRDDSPVFTYIALPGFSGSAGYSPEMGFTRNLDVYAAEGRLRGLPTSLKVTADWGWAEVPGDVQLATIWTIQDWVAKADSEGLTSEAIEGYARSWGSRTTGPAQAQAVPNRARDLLARYARVQV